MVQRKHFPQLKLDDELYEKLLEKRSISGSGCWEWTGLIGRSGYGIYVYYRQPDQKQYPFTVTRLVAAIRMGLGLYDYSVLVCHHCDNPKCFNPKHLYLGNSSSNRSDVWSRSPRSVARKLENRTHCKRGHELEKHGSWRLHNQSGKMRLQCKVCHSMYTQNYIRRKKKENK